MQIEPQIIDSAETEYLSWLANNKKLSEQFRGGRVRDTYAVSYDQVCRHLEATTLQYLSDRYSFLTGKVLKLQKQGRRRGLNPFQFLELDLVKYDSGGAPVFCEIKHSISTANAMRCARKQVRRRLKGAESRWPKATGIVICYFMSCISPDQSSAKNLVENSVLDDYFSESREPGIIEFCIDGSEHFAQMKTTGHDIGNLQSALIQSHQEMLDPVSTIHLDRAPINSSAMRLPASMV